MQDFGSRKDKYYFHNYLTSLVKALENKHTIIDLRNESCVSGLIKYVDGQMNVEMESVVFYDPKGSVYKFSEFYVSSRNIRYVHIPEGESSIELIKKQLNVMQPGKFKEKKKMTLKASRAKQYNEEILRSAYASQPGSSKS